MITEFIQTLKTENRILINNLESEKQRNGYKVYTKLRWVDELRE